MNHQSQIQLHQLEFDVYLGWPKEERSAKQSVVFDIAFNFKETPNACQSDRLDETYCYKKLIEKIAAHLENKKYRLLEALGFDIYSLIKNNLPEATQIKLQVTKKPLIPNLKGGVTFCYAEK
jgi:FolB domain-containing protein